MKSGKSLLDFSAGEWSPKLNGRVDLEQSHRACRTLRGAIILPSRAVKRRPGLQHMAFANGYGSAGGGVCPMLGQQWYSNVQAAGGTANATDRAIICELAHQLEGKDYYDDIWLFCPFVGRDLNAALVPLINRLRDTAAAADGSLVLYPSVDLDDTNFAPTVGLSGFTTTRYVNLGADALSNILNTKDINEVGFGVWLTDAVGANLFAWGCDDGRTGGTSPAFIGTISSTQVGLRRGFQVNDPLWTSTVAETPQEALYDTGHRHETFARFLRNGVQIAEDTTVDQAAGGTTRALLGAWGHTPFGSPGGTIEPVTVFPYEHGAAGCYYFRGPMTNAQIADLYATVRDYLITPTGR